MAVTGGPAHLLGVFWIGVATETYSKNPWSVLRGRESNARVKSGTLPLDLHQTHKWQSVSRKRGCSTVA